MKAEPKKRDAEKSKAAIIRAARRLFAERGIAKASIRDIAKAAGVSHGLVQQYFGTRKRLISEIIRSEIEEFCNQPLPSGAGRTDSDLDNFRSLLKTGMAGFRDYALIITRAELAGVKPEKLLDPDVPNPAMLLAAFISELQAKAPSARKRMDPLLVSAYINASLFAFATMSPWLMTSVGLKPEDYEARLDEIADICVQLVALAGGTTDGKA